MAKNSVWLTEINVTLESSDSFMEAFEDFADSISCFEDASPEDWLLQLYTQKKPNAEEIESRLSSICQALNINIPEYSYVELPDTDWVAESQKNFKPVEADKFFIHPSWDRQSNTKNLIDIEIDPQQAFGTGGHETTKNCLVGLSRLSRQHNFKNILDVGCGSGILAIAAAKLWPDAEVIGVDNDLICVETSIKNAEINNVSAIVQFYASDGYKTDVVKNNAPYDLIVANILAEPLITLAPDAKNNIAKGGHIILSGLLEKQADNVLKAHEKQGFSLVEKISDNNWVVFLLKA